jgi:predicted RNA-binding Zn-ribbon protein involved in translation (DUF1610 family)
MTWMHKIRLRALALVVAIALVAIGAISLAALPTWPVVGAAVATVALALNSMTSRLSQPTCWGCGESIAKMPSGEYGVICPNCGAITQGRDNQPRQG